MVVDTGSFSLPTPPGEHRKQQSGTPGNGRWPPSVLNPLADVLSLGHIGDVKSIIFHPTASEFIRGEDLTIRREIGEALRDLQKGLHLGMPLSRPMSDLAPGAHELRVTGTTTAVRVFYFVKLADAICPQYS